MQTPDLRKDICTLIGGIFVLALCNEALAADGCLEVLSANYPAMNRAEKERIMRIPSDGAIYFGGDRNNLAKCKVEELFMTAEELGYEKSIKCNGRALLVNNTIKEVYISDNNNVRRRADMTGKMWGTKCRIVAGPSKYKYDPSKFIATGTRDIIVEFGVSGSDFVFYLQRAVEESYTYKPPVEF